MINRSGSYIAAFCLTLIAAASFAQGIQLSAEQQQMLNQLPPAQRQQAMEAIRQLEAQQAQAPQQSIVEQPTAAPVGMTSSAVDEVLTSDVLVAQGRSRLIINFTPAEDTAEADPATRGLEGNQLYILDEDGVLSLPGFEPIPLLGLAERDIERRLSAEPYLDNHNIGVRILGQENIGPGALRPFGYDIFEPKGTTFDPPASGPVPSDYILGPGDTVRVQLFGNVNSIYEYEVTRDGTLNLPELGPVTVAGLSFAEFRADVNKRVQEMLIGTQVSVTMGQLRTIRVFVLGDVNEPGSYVVGGLSTISSALYRSGGVSDIGSLRDIQLKRNGRVVSKLDTYDLLIRGDNSGDSRLQQGDVIFVPPIGKTVTVGGAVRRPAIYEVRRLTTAADLVGLAGGLKPDAFAGGARLERIGENGGRTVLPVDLSSESANEIRIRTGDTLQVPQVLPELNNAVTLAGHVYRPGDYPWRAGMRLTDLIQSPEELMQGVDTGYVLIRREKERGQPLEVLSANLDAALRSPGSPHDILLEAADTVHVFSMALGRQRVVEPLLEELRLQSTIDAPVRHVQISGNVRAPGVYPLDEGMRVSDLIRAGGDLTESAYALDAELTRYSANGGTGRETEIVNVNLDAIRRGDVSADLALREHDYLIVNRVPDWDSTWTV
ncbi:MAG: SLBB domain-containing protein, partial [Gammaproteobacteria bacterium]|nr:SLBB domain-containing protein [Gammaproteobacteria bacterium]